MKKKNVQKKTRLLINSISSVGLVDKGANTASDVLFTKRVSDEARAIKPSPKKVATKKSSVQPKGSAMKQKAKAKSPVKKEDVATQEADIEEEIVESQVEGSEATEDEDADAAPTTPDATEDADATTEESEDLSDSDIDEAADTTDDDDEGEDVETAKAVDLEKADLMKRLKASEERASNALAIAKVERDKRLNVVAIKKAGTIAGAIAKADEFGPVLRRMHQKLPKADVTYIETMLTKANNIVKSSELFKSTGSDEGEDFDIDSGTSESEVQLNKMATARAAEKDISFETAYLEVADENPELYETL